MLDIVGPKAFGYEVEAVALPGRTTVDAGYVPGTHEDER